jgi:hypothetical protein
MLAFVSLFWFPSSDLFESTYDVQRGSHFADLAIEYRPSAGGTEKLAHLG